MEALHQLDGKIGLKFLYSWNKLESLLKEFFEFFKIKKLATSISSINGLYYIGMVFVYMILHITIRA